MWAMDNWIYSANHTVRYRYDAGVWARETTNFRGQWGITQDDYGRLFYNSNSDPLRMDVVPAEYLRRNPNLVEPRGANVQLVNPKDLTVWPSRVTIGVNRGYRMLREDGTLPVVTAACGPVIYRGSLFPKDFYGNAFIAEPAGNLVKRAIVDAREGVPTARNAYERTEFLTSTDERFRPVNLYNGPDGSLYVVDMYRGIIQHRIFITTYLRNQILERGLEAPVGMGRIYRVVPEVAAKAKPMNLAKLRTPELVKELEHADGWRRDTAQRLLVERKDPQSVQPLRTLVQSSSNALARLHAVWTLNGMASLDFPTILRALTDADVQVAVAGVRASESWLRRKNKEVLETIALRISWGELNFRRQAALSLGVTEDAAGLPLLLQLARESGSQPYMADAIASSALGHELDLIKQLIGTTSNAELSEHSSAVIAALGAAVLQSNSQDQIQEFLDYLTAPSQSVSSAVLNAIERFIPGEPPKQRVAFLPAEPSQLIEFSKSKSDQAARAQAALELLRWKGQQIDTSEALVSLTPEQQAAFEKGKQAYATCAACHQPSGEGMSGLAPPLVGSRWVNGGVDALTRIVLTGKTSGEMTMPPLGALDDETIANILTYIRRAWGHRSDPVSATQVQWVRSQIENREEPWTDDELEPMN
jgi:mono/diheme cytochrome c family protein